MLQQQAFPESEIPGIAADLSTAKGAEACFVQAPEADILVNNLGTAVFMDFIDTTDEDWLSIFQLNLEDFPNGRFHPRDDGLRE